MSNTAFNSSQLSFINSFADLYISSACKKTLSLLRKLQKCGFRSIENQEFTCVNDWLRYKNNKIFGVFLRRLSRYKYLTIKMSQTMSLMLSYQKIIKRKSFLILFFCILPFLGITQNIHQTYSFACNQMEAENYETAIEDFRRVLFFDKGEYGADVSLKLAYCYSAVADYNNSIKFYDLAYVFADSDSLQAEILFKKAGTYILSHNYNFALIELFNIDEEISIEMTSRLNFYKGIIYFQTEQFDKSKSHFQKLLEDPAGRSLSTTSSLAQLNKIFNDTKKLKRYNPKVTKIMSLIIPGSGQLYVGDYKNAANSFILTAGIVILFGHVAREYSLVDGYLSVFPWYQRYYVGGYKATGPITLQKRQERKEKIYLELLQLIQNNH